METIRIPDTSREAAKCLLLSQYVNYNYWHSCGTHAKVNVVMFMADIRRSYWLFTYRRDLSFTVTPLIKSKAYNITIPTGLGGVYGGELARLTTIYACQLEENRLAKEE